MNRRFCFRSIVGANLVFAHARRYIILFLVLLPVLVPNVSAQDQYLLMKPIQKAVNTGDFKAFKSICLERISVHFEPPFEFSGYVYTETFIDSFSMDFSQFEVSKFEWITKQIDGNFAVQSLNLILRNKRSDKTVYYKFIFFITKKNKEWKIYYFKGLNI